MDQPQYQPMFVLKSNGEIYFRKDIATAYKMEPAAYKALMRSPEHFSEDYGLLTKWQAFKLFIRLRVVTIIPFIWPNPQKAPDDAPHKTLPDTLVSASGSHQAMSTMGLTQAADKPVDGEQLAPVLSHTGSANTVASRQTPATLEVDEPTASGLSLPQ